MRTITEPAREIPVIMDADVVVCGGGPGGFSAAIAAARHGARTVLIERYGFLGGLATAGLVAPILGHTASKSHIPIVEGLLREITERMHALGCAPTWEEALQEWGIRFDAEALKIVLDEMCREAGVQLLLHSYISDVVMSDSGRVAAIIIENKSGRQAVTGKVFIDATGDADVAYRAGAATTHGRPFDGRGESMGAFFHLAGYEPLDEERAGELRELIEHEMEDGRFRFYNPNFLNQNTHHTDHSSPNMVRYGGDSTSADDMTRAELSIRRDVWELVRYLQASVRDSENRYIQQMSPQVGPRESRQIVGPMSSPVRMCAARPSSTTPSPGDRGGSTFTVRWGTPTRCISASRIAPGGRMPLLAGRAREDAHRTELYPPKGNWYDIPYRSLLSVSVPNLLSSGRCISATHEGMAGSRVMGTCIAIGQAAGTAAAMAVANDVPVAEVDVRALRQTLRADGQLV